MLLHGSFIVPEGTTDGDISSAILTALRALRLSEKDCLDHLHDEDLSHFPEYSRDLKQIRAAITLLNAIEFTPLIA